MQLHDLLKVQPILFRVVLKFRKMMPNVLSKVCYRLWHILVDVASFIGILSLRMLCLRRIRVGRWPSVTLDWLLMLIRKSICLCDVGLQVS